MSQPAKSKCSIFWTLSFLPLSPKSTSMSGRARRGDRGDLVDRKFALGEDVEHLAPDIAGRADDDHPVTHRHIPLNPISKKAGLRLLEPAAFGLDETSSFRRSVSAQPSWLAGLMSRRSVIRARLPVRPRR